MDNAFDLLYTPLVEQRIGEGRILFCQLDVTGRYGKDPTASLLVDRMLKEYAVKRSATRSPVAYLGGDQGRKLLGPLGLAIREAQELGESLRSADILAVSADEAAEQLQGKNAGIQKFLKRGGRLVLLPVAETTDLSWLPIEVKREKGDAFITRNATESPLLCGLSPSDLFWRRCVRCVRVSSESEGAWNADSGLACSVPAGKGQIVFCQIDPSWFEWCWQQGKVTRVWSTLLRNLGAASANELDLLGADKEAFSRSYHVRTLPFDPDVHVVW